MGDALETVEPAPTRSKILLVEDEVLIRVATADALREAGFVVMEAASADEAVSLIDAGLLPDVLFTDVRMPGSRDGLQLAQELKASQPELVVAITSGHLNVADGEMSSTPFFRKPYDIDHVVSFMRLALEK